MQDRSTRTAVHGVNLTSVTSLLRIAGVNRPHPLDELRSLLAGLLGGGDLGEDEVERAAGLGKDSLGCLHLLGVAPCELANGVAQLLQGIAKLAAASAPRGELGEGIGQCLAVIPEVCLASVGQSGEFAATLSEGVDKAFVFELAQSWVDGAGAGSPGTGGSLGDGLHELVAVHGLLGEQRQQRRAHIPALRSPTSCAAAMTAARCTANRVGLGGEVRMMASLAVPTAGDSMVAVTKWVVVVIGVHGSPNLNVTHGLMTCSRYIVTVS